MSLKSWQPVRSATIDTRKEEDEEWYVYLNGGRTKTGVNVWIGQDSRDLGAGEILLTL